MPYTVAIMLRLLIHMRRAIILATAAALFTAVPARASLDETGQSATFVIGHALQVQRAGQHNRLLTALRHLKDPALRPLLVHLADAPQPTLRIHGILGLAELAAPPRLDLQRVAELDDPAVQAELVTAAMGSDLLPTADALQLLAWPGLDASVKVLIATPLVEHAALPDRTILREALTADALGRRGLAALLLHQLGDAAGTQGLQTLDASADPQRDVVRAMLLRTALRHDFHRAANWAHAVATEPDANETLTMLAMQTALRFAEPRTVALWRQQYQSTSEVADQTRLALMALRMAPWLGSGLGIFDDLTTSSDALLSQIGRTGRAVATGDPQLTEHAVNLLVMHHPRVNAWAIDYAREMAAPQDAQIILLGVIRTYEQGPRRTRIARLDDVVEATQTLYERYPTIAMQLLRPILAQPGADERLIQGILLGLVRCQSDAQPVVAGLSFTDLDAQALTLLLLAKSPQPMDPGQLRDLALLVRGGGKLHDSLRVQASWVYLKRTGQVDAGLKRMLGR